MKAEWPKASKNMISFSYPAVTNKSFITHRRDIHFIFLAKERRFAFANSERSTLEHSSYNNRTLLHGLYLLGFDSRVWHMDLTHGFDHGLNESADEGRMAESFEEYDFLFLPCSNE